MLNTIYLDVINFIQNVKISLWSKVIEFLIDSGILDQI